LAEPDPEGRIMAIAFVNLHHHTTFSFGDGFGTPAQHVERAAELGYSAIAATEHGNVSSFFQLEKAALKVGIKPIFGLEAYCGSVDDKKQQFKNHLTILARNADGYRSLNRIVSQSYRDYYYHPTVSGDSIRDNKDGIIVLSGCSGSLLACTLLGGKGIPDKEKPDFEAAASVLEKFKATFGERYYIEVQPFPELGRTVTMNTAYQRLSTMTGIPLVVTCDVHYPRYSDREMQAVLHASHRGTETVDDQMRSWNYDVPLTLPTSVDKLIRRLIETGLSYEAADWAVYNSTVIADQCNVTLPKAERLRYPMSEKDLAPW
jgi:DNA polymerase III subunit alpha